ncbi:hypothetical protein GCM10007931_10570 [Vibrio algivorus]|uniref:Uncharacterized protein n=1 Tax=Vibrio algivorus TaxID=1667024 RepID=A0ABQ6ELU7_9VIBR|nr:hypothetical protein GCM10007931_10570 [Vibrio algivorus]
MTLCSSITSFNDEKYNDNHIVVAPCVKHLIKVIQEACHWYFNLTNTKMA